jgi:hypothetical protein
VGVVGTPNELFVILQETRLQVRTKQRITRRHVTIPETVPTPYFHSLELPSLYFLFVTHTKPKRTIERSVERENEQSEKKRQRTIERWYEKGIGEDGE